MRKLLSLACLGVAATPLFAAAPTPVAVWNGDFSDATKGAFTLNLNGNSFSAGKITINNAASKGVDVNTDTPLDGVTAIVRYSGLAYGSNGKSIFSSCVESSHSYDRTGVRLTVGNALAGNANNSTSSGVMSNYGTASSSPLASGYMAFEYKGGANTVTDRGTYIYMRALDGTFSSAANYWGNDTCAYSGDVSSIYGVTVGGLRQATSGWTEAKGLVVEAIAVFEGRLSVEELNAAVALVEVASDTTVSAINREIGDAVLAKVSVAGGVTISVDEAFPASAAVSVTSSGAVTLLADSQPDASYFANADFSGVEGGLLRSWLAPGVVGINFATNYGTDASGAIVAGGTWIDAGSAASGSSTALFDDGLSTASWTSANVWGWSALTKFTHGYLDDPGSGASVAISNVPYETYDVVIYCATDTSDAKFTAKTVNGVRYTWDSAQGAVVAGSSAWGKTRVEAPVYGVNALRVNGLSGALSIAGGTSESGATVRGGIAALQIMPTGTPNTIAEYTLSLDGGAANWIEAAWKIGEASSSAPASGVATINLSASTTLTVDQAVALNSLRVVGAENAVLTLVLDGGSLVAYESVTVAGGVLQQGSATALGATPTVNVLSGATLDLNGYAFGDATEVVIAGAGAGVWPWALTSSTDRETANYVYRVRLADDATVGGDNALRFQGVSGYNWSINLDGHRLTKTGTGDFAWRTVRTRGNGASEVEVDGGAWTFSEWTSLDGYETIDNHTTITLRNGASMSNGAGRRLWIDTLNWGDGVTVTTTSGGYFGIASTLNGGGSTAVMRFNDGAVATLERDLAITEFLAAAGAVTFRKADGVDPVSVNIGASFTAEGEVTVGDGVTLNLGTSRPAGTLTVADGATLTIALASDNDAPVLAASAKPANIVVYGTDGNALENPNVVFDSDTGTITITTAKVWEAKSGTGFDTAGNWSSNVAPGEGENATLLVSGDTEISVAGTYTLGSLTISGSGVVSFAGDGLITASGVIVQGGATLARSATSRLSTTAISVASGSVVRIDGTDAAYTETAAISGGGAVQSYGDVTMGENSTFTGGFTVKTGTLSAGSATATPYGAFLATGYWVTVEDGACVDIARAKDNGYALSITGKGVLQDDGTYSGAVKNTGVAMDSNARQTMRLTLNGDALVDVSTGWGLVSANYDYEIPLVLNGHTLTMRGAGTVPMTRVNASSTSGKIVLDGATLQTFGVNANNFTGVDIIVKNSGSIDFTTAPTAIGSLTIKPPKTGTSAIAWNLPEGLIPVIDTSAIDPTDLDVGEAITLFTAPDGAELEGAVTVEAGGRYDAVVSGNVVSATVKAFEPFLHYDFDSAEASTFGDYKAADSQNEIVGDLLDAYTDFTAFPGKNGGAWRVANGKLPWYGSNTANTSAFHAGEFSAVTVVKPYEANNTILWNIGSAYYTGLALIAKDEATIALVAWTGGGAGAEVVSVGGIDKLAGAWHFVAVSANANGVALSVDGVSATADATLPAGIGQEGQFGSISGSAKAYTAAGTQGLRLDDWRVYDSALTADEIRALKRTLLPSPFILRLR